MNKDEKQLAFSVVIAYRSLEQHRKIWNTLIKEGGYLKPSLKSRLTRCINLLDSSYAKYDATKVPESDLDDYKKDLNDFYLETNSKIESKIDVEKGNKDLPTQFLDSIIIVVTTVEYCLNKLTTLLSELDLLSTFKKVHNSLEGYSNYIIKEVILDV